MATLFSTPLLAFENMFDSMTPRRPFRDAARTPRRLAADSVRASLDKGMMPALMTTHALFSKEATQLLRQVSRRGAVPTSDVHLEVASTLVRVGLARFERNTLVAAEATVRAELVRGVVDKWLPGILGPER